MKKLVNNPHYFEYFTQTENSYLDLKWIENENMDWVKAYEEEEKAFHIKFNVDDTTSEEEMKEIQIEADNIKVSKDFYSVDFPTYHNWDKKFREKYDNTVKLADDKIEEIVKTAEIVHKIDDEILYINCKDGNNYFSTHHYAHGDIALIKAIDNFDSIKTAVYAYVNDYKEWKELHKNN